ncbi:MAG: 4Fe-4S binding protein [Syntrophobacteraceae bacterium]|jgi:NADH-quinone oxidoreductase subunit I|nr:4Fe-4S binding protein [Syntrophobacteraceae bacterium]
MSYFREIIDGGWSLVEGMRVTVRRLFQPLVTVQYPRKHIRMSSAYRGHIELKVFKETGTHNCIACGTCERMCPSGVIKVQGVKEQAKSPKVATHYVIDFTRCSLCGLCVETCPTQTLEYSKEYDLVGETRWDGVIDLMARLETRRAKTV